MRLNSEWVRTFKYSICKHTLRALFNRWGTHFSFLFILKRFYFGRQRQRQQQQTHQIKRIFEYRVMPFKY